MALVKITDSIAFAREMAIEYELRGNNGVEELQATLDIMNHALYGRRDNQRAYVKSLVAYLIPVGEIEAELLTEEQIVDARVDEPIMKGKIDTIHWFGSASLTGFGLTLCGVDFYRPTLRHAAQAFVPLETFDFRLAS